MQAMYKSYERKPPVESSIFWNTQTDVCPDMKGKFSTGYFYPGYTI